MNIETRKEPKEPENAAEVMARAVEFAKKRTECLVLGGSEEAALEAQLALVWDEFKDTSLSKNIGLFFPEPIKDDATDQLRLCLYKAYLLGQLSVIKLQRS